MISGSPPIIRGLGLCVFAGVLTYYAFDQINRDRRIAENPHARALVERTWVESGRGGGRFTALTFPNRIKGVVQNCEAGRVYLGPGDMRLAPGSFIDVAPRPESCGAPDMADVGLSREASLWVMVIAAAFGLIGLYTLRRSMT